MTRKNMVPPLTGTIMVKRAGRPAASRANRPGDRTRSQREIERVQVDKTVLKQDPRRACGISPNSRWNRRSPASSYLQEWEITMSEPIYLGIDVAKETFVVASRPKGVQLSLPNTSQGFAQLRQALQGKNVARIVLEATGGYESSLVADLLEAGYQVRVVNPRRIHFFAQSKERRAKTDAIDADLIAEFAQTFEFPPLPPPDPEVVELGDLVRRRKQLLELRTQELNRQQQVRGLNIRKSIRKMIKTLDYHIKEIDGLIRAQIEDDEELAQKDEILRSVPGGGPQTSAILLGLLPELGRLQPPADRRPGRGGPLGPGLGHLARPGPHRRRPGRGPQCLVHGRPVGLSM